MCCPIDNKSFAVLKAAAKKKSIAKSELSSKLHFADADISASLDVLATNKLIEFGEHLIQNNNFDTDYNTVIYTQCGKAYVENRIRDSRRWMIPVAISIIAVAISAVALTFSIITLSGNH